MLILALDSSADRCGVCVWENGHPVTYSEEFMQRGQDRRLVPLILAVLREQNMSFGDVDRVAVTTGPGSFTGIRIGLAAAYGISLAAKKPVFGVDRFALYCAEFAGLAENLLVVLASKRAELYCQRFIGGVIFSPPALLSIPDISSALAADPTLAIVGDAGDLCYFPSTALTRAEAVVCADLVATMPDNFSTRPKPFYVRPPDAKIMAPEIRPVSPHDIDALALLHLAAFGQGAWSRDQLSGTLRLETTRGWIALVNREAAGFILAQSTEAEVEILSFCVNPLFGRRGIGEKLLRTVVTFALSSCAELHLEVAADNKAAIALYKKAGFGETGRRLNYYQRGTEREDAVTFTLLSQVV